MDVLCSRGPSLPKGVLDPDADGVEVMTMHAAVADAKSLMQVLGLDMCFVLKEDKGMLKWTLMLPDLSKVPAVNGVIHIFERTTRPAAPLLPLVQRQHHITREMLVQECSQFCEKFRVVLEALGHTDLADYKTRFESSVTEVCTLFERPCLLWDGVGKNVIPLDERIADGLQEGNVTVVLAPSGSGKTRMLLEVAAQQFCLFFTGSRPSLGYFAGAGSADVDVAIRWLESTLTTVKLTDSGLDDVLNFVVGAVVLSRLYLLEFVKSLMPSLSPTDWAFFQVEYPSQNDVLRKLTDCILNLVGQNVQDVNFVNLCHTIDALVTELAMRVSWDGLTVLDESQTLLKRLENRFVASGTGLRENPVLNPLLLSLHSFGSSRMFVSGTGKSMLRVREMFLSGSMKPFHVNDVYSLGGFSEAEEMLEYMSRYIDTSGLDMYLIVAAYRGRRRWLVTALEQYMVRKHELGAETRFFMQYSHRMVTETGGQLGVVRSLYDDAMKFWSLVSDFLVENVLVSYYLGGKGYVVVEDDEVSIGLIHCGLAPLFDNTFESEYDHTLHRFSCSGQRAILQEPLVIEALWKTKPESLLGRSFKSRFSGPSGLGEIYEVHGLPALGNALNGKKLAETLGFKSGTSGVAEIYTRSFQLVECKAPGEVLVKSLKNGDGQYVSQWLEQVEKEELQFPTYLHLPSGPDGLFMMREVLAEDELENKHRPPILLPVFVKFKSGFNENMIEALSSTEVERFCRVHNCPSLLEIAKNGYVQIVMRSTPLEERRPKHEPLLEGTMVKLPVPPLQVVIYGTKVLPFVDSGILDVLKSGKPNLVKRPKIL